MSQGIFIGRKMSIKKVYQRNLEERARSKWDEWPTMKNHEKPWKEVFSNKNAARRSPVTFEQHGKMAVLLCTQTVISPTRKIGKKKELKIYTTECRHKSLLKKGGKFLSLGSRRKETSWNGKAVEEFFTANHCCSNLLNFIVVFFHIFFPFLQIFVFKFGVFYFNL